MLILLKGFRRIKNIFWGNPIVLWVRIILFKLLYPGRKVVIYDKYHPIFSDFFEKYKTPRYVWFFFAPNWIHTYFGAKALKACDIIHSDAAAFSKGYFGFSKKLIIECEGLAKDDWFANDRIAHIIFESNYAGRRQLENSKASLVYPGFEAPVIHSNPKTRKRAGELLLLSIGYGSFIKGFDISFEVFLRLKAKGYPVKLIIAGTFGHNYTLYPEVSEKAYDSAGFERILEYSRTHDDVVVSPFSRESLLREIYPAADIYLHFARMETFGFTVLEAMAFGLPVVSVKFKAIPEMVDHGVNGYLCDPFDWNGIDEIDELKMNTQEWRERCIEEGSRYSELLLRNEALRSSFKRFALEKCLEFSLEERFRKLSKFYQE